MVVDGEDVELKPGRYVWVEAESKRKILAGDEGLKLIAVGSPPGAYKPRAGLASSASTSATAASSRARFAGSFSQPDAPEGCGSGIAVAPSSSKRSPIASVRRRMPSSRRAASPPTVTIRRG